MISIIGRLPHFNGILVKINLMPPAGHYGDKLSDAPSVFHGQLLYIINLVPGFDLTITGSILLRCILSVCGISLLPPTVTTQYDLVWQLISTSVSELLSSNRRLCLFRLTLSLEDGLFVLSWSLQHLTVFQLVCHHHSTLTLPPCKVLNDACFRIYVCIVPLMT